MKLTDTEWRELVQAAIEALERIKAKREAEERTGFHRCCGACRVEPAPEGQIGISPVAAAVRAVGDEIRAKVLAGQGAACVAHGDAEPGKGAA